MSFTNNPITDKMEQPERKGKLWSPSEEQYMLKRISERATYYEIAKEIDRTHGAIRARIRHVACNLVKKGKSKEEVSHITGLKISDIEDAIQLREIRSRMKVIETFPIKKEENVLSVCIEIRDLLRKLVK